MATEVPEGKPSKSDVPRAGWANPMLHVKDVARSIHFYSLIGFTLTDIEGEPEHPGWARMTSTKDDSAIMFLGEEERSQEEGSQAEGSKKEESPEHRHFPDPDAQGILLAMYTPDLPALREHLVANGIPAPPISYPDYMPSGSLFLRDPDGYAVNIHHWSKKEDEHWHRRLAEKRAKGILPAE
jgi:catechol 2,3-dioxygenase-like lactoylglutathione lyase family enzyme